jgi:hypothetical protein
LISDALTAINTAIEKAVKELEEAKEILAKAAEVLALTKQLSVEKKHE